jgi:ferredoxin-NADP reductase
LLFITAGSGITPVMSMVRHLARTDHPAEMTWMHYARREVIFEDELVALAARNPKLRLWLHRTRGTATRLDADLHFSREQLERCAPEWTECETFVCGPPALMDAIATLWHACGLSRRLHIERFGRGLLPSALDETPRECRLVFARSGRAHLGRTGVSLLEQAEVAGSRPRYGCRIGICRQCVCRKLSGVVRNELTGELSGGSAEPIQLCINTPRTDVILDL